MERQTHLFMEMSFAIKVLGMLYFEEYLPKTTPESREAYMMWYLFDTSIQAYWNTPKKERPFFLVDNVASVFHGR